MSEEKDQKSAEPYEWGDYLRRNQTDLYAPGWGSSDDPDPLNGGEEMSFIQYEKKKSIRFVIIGISVLMSVAFLSFGFFVILGGFHHEKYYGADEPSGSDREIEIMTQLKAVSGPLVGTAGTYQNEAAMWIIGDSMRLSVSSAFLVQKYVLAVLYYSVEGADWKMDKGSTKWLGKGVPHCDWQGILCNMDGNVHGIILDSVNAGGKLPPELYALTKLVKMSFKNNHISGGIPKQWGLLDRLEFIHLQGNNILGSMPESICTLHKYNLKIITADCEVKCACCLSCGPEAEEGQSADDFTLLDRVSKISSEKSLLSEDSPQSKSFQWIKTDTTFDPNDVRLMQRYILGVLYYSLGGDNWPYSTWLSKKNECSFPGVSCELGEVVMLSLISLNMIGTIPMELGRLNSLESLDLSDNSISGTIPDSFQQLDKLENLHLQHNSITGTVPTSICKLKINDFRTDCSGSPAEITCSCCTKCTFPTHEVIPKLPKSESPSLTVAKVSTITEEGSSNIPSESDMPMSVDDERTSAMRYKIATLVSKMNKKEAYQDTAADWIIQTDQLNLKIDAPNLVQRYVLALLYFALEGDGWTDNSESWLSIKGECDWAGVLCDKGKVVSLSLASSNLKGGLPDEVSFLEHSESIDMSNNKLEGAIPEGLTNLYFLKTLHLYGNNFFGEVPEDLCYLTYGHLNDLRIDCGFRCDCCTVCGPPP